MAIVFADAGAESGTGGPNRRQRSTLHPKVSCRRLSDHEPHFLNVAM